MLLPAASILAGFLLLLPQPTTQFCKSATGDVCRQAQPAPGSSLAGEGFDITTMQRKGAFVIDMNTWETPNKICNLCANPYQNGKMQKIPTSVSSFKALHKCSMSIKSELLESAMSVADHASKSVENDWKLGLNLSKAEYGGTVALSGTNSKSAKTAIEKSKSDRFNFVSHSVQCGFYSYMISNNAQLDPDFQQAFEKLPQIYSPSSKAEFEGFLDTYGTHYIKQVQTGGKVESMTSVRECQASMMGLSSDEVKMCLGAEAAAKIPQKVDDDLRAQINFCNSKKDYVTGRRSFSNVFSDRVTEISGGMTTEGELLFSADRDASAYNKWLTSLPSNPDVITYTLKSLHELIPDKKKKTEMMQAIQDYIVSRGMKQQCSDQCKVGRRTNSKSCVCHCHNHKSLGRNCCPMRPGYADVVLTIICGHGLFGDDASGTDGYVKVFDENKQLLGMTRTILGDDDPCWNREFDFSDMLLSERSKIEMEVWDEDNKYDDLLGTCIVNLRSDLPEKVHVCSLDYGQIYYSLKVTCGPHLSGPTCSDYAASPMSSQLDKMFVSRNAVPIPKHMFPKAGMQMGRQAFNYTFNSQQAGKAEKADYL